jgi:hypothetical protein
MAALQQMIAQAVAQGQNTPDISLPLEQIESLKRGGLVAGKCARRSPRTLETRIRHRQAGLVAPSKRIRYFGQTCNQAIWNRFW